MEINITILENEDIHAAFLSNMIKTWAAKNSVSANIHTYRTGTDLLNGNILYFHAFFLDIQLDDMSGIQVAKKLRQLGCTAEIIFLTAYSEYVFDGYDVRALNYILKPISYDKLSSCMDAIMKSIKGENYILRSRDTIEKIPCKDIIYISSARHHMEIYTSGEVYRHLISIKEIMKNLPDQFIQCHRTLIININYVRKLEGHNVIMKGNITLPVSNTYLQNVRKKLESLIF